MKAVQRLDFNPKSKVKETLAGIGNYYPIGLEKLKEENSQGNIIQRSPRVEYNLTNKGQELFESVMNLLQWMRRRSSKVDKWFNDNCI